MGPLQLAFELTPDLVKHYVGWRRLARFHVSGQPYMSSP